MSNSETTVPIDNFTIGSLKVYEDEKIANLKEFFLALREDDKEAIKAALLTVKEDNDKIALAYEKRFDNVNEFRGQQKDIIATFLPRKEYDARHETLVNQVAELNNRMNRSDGKSTGLSAGWGYLAGAVGLAATIIGVILAFNN